MTNVILQVSRSAVSRGEQLRGQWVQKLARTGDAIMREAGEGPTASFLLLHWDLHQLGCSRVQQHEPTDRHGQADPPQRRPCLPEEQLSQDSLKEKRHKALLG